MRSFCIGLLTIDGTPRSTDGARNEQVADVLRNWPKSAKTPKVEPISAVDFLDRVTPEALAESKPSWDAIVIDTSAGVDEGALCRLLDAAEVAMLPVLLLTGGQGARLNGFHSGTVIPVGEDDDCAQAAGMLFALASRQTTVRATTQDLRVAESYTGSASVEMERIQQELLLAARVQRDFMPRGIPAADGFQAAVLFRPAGFVSGDTYDVYRLDEHHIGFLVADAMGHGIPAALMTLFVSGCMPKKELTPEGFRIVQPAEALTRLNASLHECLEGPSRFVTAICGIVDTRTGLISLACAGHPPALRVSPTHGVRPVDASGMLLGVVGDYQYDQVAFRLEDDEVLVLHSDGIEAAFGRAGNDDSSSAILSRHMSRFAAMRRAHTPAGLAENVRILCADIDAQSGSLHQEDDQTLLVIQTAPLMHDAGEIETLRIDEAQVRAWARA